MNTCEICKEGECKACGACSCTPTGWLVLKRVTSAILIIGGINWALYGIFDFDIVEFLLGFGLAANIGYGLFGIVALYKIIVHVVRWINTDETSKPDPKKPIKFPEE